MYACCSSGYVMQYNRLQVSSIGLQYQFSNDSIYSYNSSGLQ